MNYEQPVPPYGRCITEDYYSLKYENWQVAGEWQKLLLHNDNRSIHSYKKGFEREKLREKCLRDRENALIVLNEL